MANRLQDAAADLLKTAGFLEQPDGSWKPSALDGAGLDTATPAEVAIAIKTSVAGLAQMRYRKTGPKYIRVSSRKVIYRWSDVRAYLDANTCQRADEPVSA
jgi:hypothetical protein